MSIVIASLLAAGMFCLLRAYPHVKRNASFGLPPTRAPSHPNLDSVNAFRWSRRAIFFFVILILVNVYLFWKVH